MNTKPIQSTELHAEIAALIEESVSLHTLPVVVLEANRIINDPASSAQDVANLIANDPALAERVLRLSNSAFYGFQKRIGNITQAIVILGFQAVKNLMITVTVIDSFQKDQNDSTDYPAFWAHSVCTAIAANKLASLSKCSETEEAYISGLLHDVGKIIICQHLPELEEKVIESQQQGYTRIEAELAHLGQSHAEIGAQVANAWGLPNPICDAIRNHHNCTRGEDDPFSLADVLQLADAVAHGFGLGNGSQPLPSLHPELSQRMGYDSDRLGKWLEVVSVAVEQSSDFFEYIGAGKPELSPEKMGQSR